jgi:hypothetical protein
MRMSRRACRPIVIGVVVLLAGSTSASAAPHLGLSKVRRHRISRHATKTADGLVEIESDIERDEYPDGSRGAQVTTTGRLRLADGLQLNLIVPVLSTEDSSAMGLGDVAAGVNVQLLDDVPVLGDVFALPTVKLPTGSLELATGTGTTDAGILMVSSNQIGPVNLDLSAGYTRRNGDGMNAPIHSTSWSAALDGPLRGPLGWSMEWSGLPATSGPAGAAGSAALTIGPTLSVHDWLVIDAAVMVPLAGAQPKAIFVSAVYKSPKIKPAASATP